MFIDIFFYKSFKASLRVGRVLLLLMIAFSAPLRAQERTVTGNVKAAEDNSALIGASVVVKGTSIGTVTDINGGYKISVPEGRNTLVFRYIGYKTQEVNIGDRTVINITMEIDAKLQSEVIVTGVAEGRSTKLITFSVGKIDEQTLKEVPASDAATALRGKVAGVQIVQPSGVPGTAPEIRLRGVTNIQGTSTPLIIIDGILTPPGTNLADINVNDIETIEILKGAAAASLYGSQAANGVVQIITKRGADTPNKTEYTLRSEWGSTSLQRFFPVNNSHRWRLDNNGNFLDGNATASGIQRTFEADQIFDNSYPAALGGTRNQQAELYRNFVVSSNYASIGSTLKNTNFLASGERFDQPGILPLAPAFQRYNARLNIDHRIDKLKLSGSMFYANSTGPDATERQQGGPFYGILYLEPDFDLNINNPDGSPYWAYPGQVAAPGRQGVSGNNAINPLYSLNQTRFDVRRNRFLGNALLSYQFADFLRAEAQLSYDRANEGFQVTTKKSTYNANMSAYTNGGMTISDFLGDGLIGTGSLYFNRTFSDVSVKATLRYQYENYTTRFDQTSGSSFAVEDLFQVQNLDRTTLNVVSSATEVRAENIILNAVFDYKEKYILEASIRRDGTSLFGADQRYQNFFRVGGSWRITQDVQIPNIQEWKIRATIGTTGQRPPFDAQYETFSIAGGVPQKVALGNRNLRSSRVQELELGTNVLFLNRFNFEFNYATSSIDDAIINVPLPAFSGFTQQFQNIGQLRTNTLEFQLGGELFRENDFAFNLNITASRTLNEVTRLGRAPFSTNGLFGTAGNIAIANDMFRIQEGQPLGIMFGNIHATSLDQLITDANGNVINLRAPVGAQPTGLKREDFTVNSDGYVIRRFRPTSATVPANTPAEGTVDEIALLLLDTETQQPLVAEIGNGNPAFIAGLNGTFTWKNLSLYVLVDFQFGGNIYNATRQLLYFSERHADLDQAGKPEERKKTATYYASLYNGNSSTKHFVESGAYTWIREVNLSYTFGKELLEPIGLGFFRDIRLSLIGRNLFVFTPYSGYSPEVALANNSTTYRVDQFAYPLFRSVTGTLQVRF